MENGAARARRYDKPLYSRKMTFTIFAKSWVVRIPQELRSLERPLFKPVLCRLGSSLAFLPTPRSSPDFARRWLRGLGCFQYPASGTPCMDTVHDETSDNDGQNAGCHGKQLHNGIRNNNRFHCLPLIGCDANSYFRTRISTAVSIASVSTYRRRGSCKCSLQGTEKRPGVQPRGPSPYVEEMQAFAEQHANFQWHLHLSEKLAQPGMCSGLVHEAVRDGLLRTCPDIAVLEVYCAVRRRCCRLRERCCVLSGWRRPM